MPTQLLSVNNLLSASLVIASFGSSTPYNSPAFDLKIEQDPAVPLPSSNKPLRYGKLPEIHHIFKSDPKSPPKIITVVFTAAVIFTLPALIIAVSLWIVMLKHTLTDDSVGISRCQCEPCFESLRQFTNTACDFLPIRPFNGGCLLHVLYLMEPLPDSSSGHRRRLGHVLERQPCASRSSRQTAGWLEIGYDVGCMINAVNVQILNYRQKYYFGIRELFQIDLSMCVHHVIPCRRTYHEVLSLYHATFT